MESFSLNGVVQAEYQHNHLGHQAIRHLPQQGMTIDSVFGPDGNQLAEFDHDSEALLREYVWFDGKPIAVVEGGQVYYVRADHIGRPVFVTDDTASVVWTASHLPFGGVHTSTGNSINLRFPGQWFQSETVRTRTGCGIMAKPPVNQPKRLPTTPTRLKPTLTRRRYA